jgi:hypothetical protein
MKMADGGFRPAWNVQVISAAGEQIVIDINPLGTGSDRGLLRPSTAPIRTFPVATTGPGCWPDGQAIYRERSICECIHARWRNWNLARLNVRGIAKIRAVMLWYALANNIIQGH